MIPLDRIVVWIANSIIVVTAVQNLVGLLQFVAAAIFLSRRDMIRRTQTLWRRSSGIAPRISIIVPAFNEERTIIDSVRSLLSLQYPQFEVIVVNDGSEDATIQRLTETYALERRERRVAHPLTHRPTRATFASQREKRLFVVDKINGGKADALNCGISYATAPIVCAVDADSFLETDAILRAIEPFVSDPKRTIAVGAAIRIANGCEIRNGVVLNYGLPKSILALFQVVEYMRAFLMARLAWSQFGALSIISGAFGLFRRDAVLEVGGYDCDTVGEDMELVIRMHRFMRDRNRDYSIVFLPETACWTEAPETIGELGRQRVRWQRGSMETFFKHWGIMISPRYGRIGVIAFLHILIVDVIGPFAEFLGYLLLPYFWFIGALSTEYLLAFLALAIVLGIAISVGGMVLEEMQVRRFYKAGELAVLLLAAILENFGYRQICNLWRMKGCFEYLLGKKGWTEIRAGDPKNSALSELRPAVKPDEMSRLD